VSLGDALFGAGDTPWHERGRAQRSLCQVLRCAPLSSCNVKCGLQRKLRKEEDESDFEVSDEEEELEELSEDDVEEVEAAPAKKEKRARRPSRKVAGAKKVVHTTLAFSYIQYSLWESKIQQASWHERHHRIERLRACGTAVHCYTCNMTPWSALGRSLPVTVAARPPQPDCASGTSDHAAIMLPCSTAHHRTWLQSKAKAKGDGSEFEVDDEKAELEELAESEAEDDGGTFRLGQQDEEFHDYSALALKEDARNRLDCIFETDWKKV